MTEAAELFGRAPDTPGCMITHAPSGGSADALTLFGRQLRADDLSAVEARLRQATAEVHVRADTDCAEWAGYVTGVVQGMSVQARDGVSREALYAIAAIAARSLEVLRPPSGTVPIILLLTTPARKGAGASRKSMRLLPGRQSSH